MKKNLRINLLVFVICHIFIGIIDFIECFHIRIVKTVPSLSFNNNDFDDESNPDFISGFKNGPVEIKEFTNFISSKLKFFNISYKK